MNNKAEFRHVRRALHSTYHLLPDDNKLHFHRVIELGICLSGSGFSEVNGQIQEFHPGDMQIIFPFQRHRNQCTSKDPCIFRWEYIDAAFLAVETSSSFPKLAQIMEQISIYGNIQKAEFPHLYAQLHQFLTTIIEESHTAFYAEKLYAQLLLLLISFAQEAVSRKQYPQVRLPEQFRLISSTLIHLSIQLSQGEIPTVSELAQHSRLPLSTFRKVFRDIMDLSPKEYILGCAVQQACNQLLLTDQTVTDIAGSCGFSEITTFNRAFRKFTGQSPLQYRKSARQSSSDLSDFA